MNAGRVLWMVAVTLTLSGCIIKEGGMGLEGEVVWDGGRVLWEIDEIPDFGLLEAPDDAEDDRSVVCEPQCEARACGGDGCGGVCGYCDGDHVCDREGACVVPASPTCSGRPVADEVRESAVLWLSAEGEAGLYESSCGGRALGPEVVVVVWLEERQGLELVLTSLTVGHDPVLHVRRRCGDQSTEIGCDDDSAGALNSYLVFEGMAAGRYDVIVDGYAEGDDGEMRLDIVITEPVD